MHMISSLLFSLDLILRSTKTFIIRIYLVCGIITPQKNILIYATFE